MNFDYRKQSSVIPPPFIWDKIKPRRKQLLVMVLKITINTASPEAQEHQEQFEDEAQKSVEKNLQLQQTKNTMKIEQRYLLFLEYDRKMDELSIKNMFLL
uniref:Uncharacterized protein n=1 Tax=Helianthus annuus TaxID=4232 RepID=A0A251SWC4_HELAN